MRGFLQQELGPFCPRVVPTIDPALLCLNHKQTQKKPTQKKVVKKNQKKKNVIDQRFAKLHSSSYARTCFGGMVLSHMPA
jgi:hypothetical protein